MVEGSFCGENCEVKASQGGTASCPPHTDVKRGKELQKIKTLPDDNSILAGWYYTLRRHKM